LTSLCLPANVGAQAAARYFSRPRIGNLFGMLAEPVHVAVAGDPSTRLLPFIERIWMPAFAVRVHAASKKTEHSVWTAVEGINGEFSMLECDQELAERELDGDVFSATIDETRVAALARKGMMHYVLIQRGLMNKPIVDGIEEIRPYHHPVWVCYYRRRNVFLDVMVQDARTGKSGGAKMRISVLHALVGRNKELRQAANRQTDPQAG
jgi:hypothetical protein